jgi:hypothetical protein
MTTPRFLILPDLIVNVNDIVAAYTFSDNADQATAIDLRDDRGTVYTGAKVSEVTAALRKAMKGPTAPDMAGPPWFPHVPIDIEKQARETKAAGKP